MLKRIRVGHLAVLFLLIGLLCVAAFHFMDAWIDTLEAPAPLVSLAGGFFVSAAIAGVMHFCAPGNRLLKLRRKRRRVVKKSAGSRIPVDL